MSVVDRWIEEDYFASLCIVLDNIGCYQNKIEEVAHMVMDAHTVDGVLNTETLDAAIDKLIGV